jgi:hypothetical protein
MVTLYESFEKYVLSTLTIHIWVLVCGLYPSCRFPNSIVVENNRDKRNETTNIQINYNCFGVGVGV